MQTTKIRIEEVQINYTFAELIRVFLPRLSSGFVAAICHCGSQVNVRPGRNWRCLHCGELHQVELWIDEDMPGVYEYPDQGPSFVEICSARAEAARIRAGDF